MDFWCGIEFEKKNGLLLPIQCPCCTQTAFVGNPPAITMQDVLAAKSKLDAVRPSMPLEEVKQLAKESYMAGKMRGLVQALEPSLN